MQTPYAFAIAAFLLISLAGPLLAQETDTADVLASEVTTLVEALPDDNFGSSFDAAIWASTANNGAVTLMRFDDIDSIPGEIVDAELVLSAIDTDAVPGELLTLFHITHDGWDEATATWNNVTVTGSFPAASTEQPVNNGLFAMGGGDLVEILNDMRSGAIDKDDGFLLVHANPTTHNSQIVIDSNYSTTPALRPVLTITYQVRPSNDDDGGGGGCAVVGGKSGAAWLLLFVAVLIMRRV